MQLEYESPKGLYLSKAKIEEIANTVAKELNYSSGGPLEVIVSELGGKISISDVFDDEQKEQIKVNGEGNFTIYIPNYTSPHRDRFTVAHELGHYVLHSKFGEIKLIAGRDGDSIAEREANWFAAALLMPKDEFNKKCSDGLNNIELSRHFAVSPRAIEVRKKVLGIE